MSDDDAAGLEADIAGCLARGDHGAAATAALRGYGPPVYGYLCAVIRNDADAAEVFSDFSEDLWKGIGSFRGECPFRAWAYRVAYHAAMRHLRDPERRRLRRLETSEWSHLAAEVQSTTAAHLRADATGALARLRDALSAEEQTLLTLRIDRKLPWREVAAVIAVEDPGVTEAVLRKRFERLRDKLRELLDAGALSD